MVLQIAVQKKTIIHCGRFQLTPSLLNNIQHWKSLTRDRKTRDRPVLFRRPTRPAPVSDTVGYRQVAVGTQTRAGL